MCAILLSEELGLFRVYPISADAKFPVWSRVHVVLETTTKDTRAESFKLKSFTLGDKVTDRSDKRALLDQCCLSSGAEDPQDMQNHLCKSIYVVKPKPAFLGAKISAQEPQADNHWVMTQQKTASVPVLMWTSKQGKNHEAKIVSREVYEWIRQHPVYPYRVFENLQINNPDFEKWLVMGNMNKRRNVWCCVHVHRLKKTAEISIPSFCSPMNGSNADWPYSQQREENVAVADGQLEMFTT